MGTTVDHSDGSRQQHAGVTDSPDERTGSDEPAPADPFERIERSGCERGELLRELREYLQGD